MKLIKRKKTLKLKKVTVADLNWSEMKVVRGGQLSCDYCPEPTETCDCNSFPTISPSVPISC